MSDIAQRLKDESCGFGIGHALLMQEAASEIERLRLGLKVAEAALRTLPEDGIVHIPRSLWAAASAAAGDAVNGQGTNDRNSDGDSDNRIGGAG